MALLAENRYGKSRVRLMKVTRHAHGNDLREWTVQVMLRGDFDSAHVDGDNSKILATDTMKNTVYFVARNSKATTMEGYAKQLINYLLERNPQVSSASVEVASTLWKRLTIDGKAHPDSFMRGSDERQTTTVERAQEGEFQVVSGLKDLVILKTAKSAFTGYIKEPLTTLPETEDRLFCTSLTAQWEYNTEELDYDAVRGKIREAMLRTFAAHDSKSVQQTLYAMAEDALEVVPQVDDIEITMPNKHNLLVDLSRFGQDNPNEIFVPTDEPHGLIQARIVRGA
jgi:urate oxidase